MLERNYQHLVRPTECLLTIFLFLILYVNGVGFPNNFVFCFLNKICEDRIIKCDLGN